MSMKKNFYIFKFTYITGVNHVVIIAKTLEEAIKKFYNSFNHLTEIHSIKCLGTEKEIMIGGN